MKTIYRITETKEPKKVINCVNCGAARFEYRDGIKVCSYCGSEAGETPFVTPSIIHKQLFETKAYDWLLTHNFNNGIMDAFHEAMDC